MRVKAGFTASYEGQSQPLSQIGNGLIYKETRQVEYKGKPATQWIGETSVVLIRKAQPFLKDRTERKTRHKSGEPLPAQLIVSRIMGADGHLLAEWYLLSNLEQEVAGERLALWYYWRWRIESYFKLLKGGGHQLENWQQESGEAVFKRLLIASQALVILARKLARVVFALLKGQSEYQPKAGLGLPLNHRISHRESIGNKSGAGNHHRKPTATTNTPHSPPATTPCPD